MSVSLTPELERFLNEQVRSGRYSSKEEAVGKAIELLKEMDEAEGRLETLLQEAEDSGPATEMTAQDWADIANQGIKRLRSGKSASFHGSRDQARCRKTRSDGPFRSLGR